MDLICDVSNEVLRPDQPLLGQTLERRFRLESEQKREGESKKDRNREAYYNVRSTSRVRMLQAEYQPFSSLTGLQKLRNLPKALPKIDSLMLSDILRVVIVGDACARGEAARSLMATAMPNMLQEWKLGIEAVTVSQIELESMEAMSFYVAPKALFVLALDGTDDVVQRARGLLRVVVSRLPNGVRPLAVLFVDKV
jgi:hypothetical protein